MKGPGRIWLDGVRHLPSPNADERPPGTAVDLLVIHNISLPPGHFGDGQVQAFFTNRLDPLAHPYFASIADLTVSAHLLIERDGTTTQFVALDRRAWHAGPSRLGSLRAATSRADFIAIGERIYYHSPAYGFRNDRSLWQETAERLVAVDLRSGTELWAVALLDLVYRGPMPP